MTPNLLVPSRVFDAFVKGCPVARAAIVAQLNSGTVVARALDHLADDHDLDDGAPAPAKRPA